MSDLLSARLGRGGWLFLRLLPAIEPELKEDGGQCDEGTEEFAREFDPGIIRTHGNLRHGKGLVAEEVGIEPRTRHGHFNQASGDGDDKKEAWDDAEAAPDKASGDDEVKQKPQGGVE